MEENVLIKSEQLNVKKVFTIMVIVGCALSILLFALSFAFYIDMFDHYYEEYLVHEEAGSCGKGYDRGEMCYICSDITAFPGRLVFALFAVVAEGDILIALIPVATLWLVGGIVYLCLHGFELTVTDKRIFGTIHKKRVDLPIDSVSAVSIGAFRSISIATSSGKISFSAIKNHNEIHKVVSDLLVKRQSKLDVAPTVSTPVASNADELKKYKELLDMGVISNEEFEAKKKQLLGL